MKIILLFVQVSQNADFYLQKSTAILKISRIFVARTEFMTRIQQAASDMGGTILTSELQSPRVYYSINKDLRSGEIIRIKNGVYVLPEELSTAMPDIERIVPNGVVCMYSAWNYYNLSTQIPNGFYIAIEKHRKVVAPPVTGIVLCYWEEKYCSMGVEQVEIAGHKVKISNIEKSVCDAVKFRNKIGTDVTVEILKNYLSRRERNISRLMEYSKSMRIASTMNTYLEMGL